MIDTMQKRKSVRCYSERPLTPEVRGEIENILQAQGKGFFGNTPRFALIERERTRQEQQVRLGTYGFIRGAAHFIAGAIARGPRAEADFGCLMENIVLEMTRLGLGTCWLGGTFSREEYAQVLHLDEKSWVPAILSLGYPAASRGTIERVVRWKAKADSRLPFEALFFEGDFTRPLSEAAAGGLCPGAGDGADRAFRFQQTALAGREEQSRLPPHFAAHPWLSEVGPFDGFAATRYGHRHEPLGSFRQGVGA